MNAQDMARGWLAEYLGEYGPDGYDQTTMVDFLVAQLHRPGDLGALARWYIERAKTIRRELRQLRRAHP